MCTLSAEGKRTGGMSEGAPFLQGVRLHPWLRDLRRIQGPSLYLPSGLRECLCFGPPREAKAHPQEEMVVAAPFAACVYEAETYDVEEILWQPFPDRERNLPEGLVQKVDFSVFFPFPFPQTLPDADQADALVSVSTGRTLLHCRPMTAVVYPESSQVPQSRRL